VGHLNRNVGSPDPNLGKQIVCFLCLLLSVAISVEKLDIFQIKLQI
jgi:hypothetical protein